MNHIFADIPESSLEEVSLRDIIVGSDYGDSPPRNWFILRVGKFDRNTGLPEGTGSYFIVEGMEDPQSPNNDFGLFRDDHIWNITQLARQHTFTPEQAAELRQLVEELG